MSHKEDIADALAIAILNSHPDVEEFAGIDGLVVRGDCDVVADVILAAVESRSDALSDALSGLARAVEAYDNWPAPKRRECRGVVEAARRVVEES